MNPELEVKSYIQSLPINELVDLRNVINRQRLNEFGWPSTVKQAIDCQSKIDIINSEIERRKDLII